MYEHELIEIGQYQLPFKIIRHINKSGFTQSHWHHSFEISYTVKGQIDQFTINEKVFNTKEGDVLLVNSNEIHSVKVRMLPNKSTEALTILLPYSFMNKEIPDFGIRYYYIPKTEDFTPEQVTNYPVLQAYLKMIFDVTKQINKIELIRIKSIIYEVMYILTVYFSKISIDKENPHNESMDFEWIDAVLVYLYDHLFEQLTVGKLAKTFHLNESYFSRKFKKNMGISVKKYITEMRVIAASHLITQTAIPIQVIADKCGFTNHKSFTKSFKEKYQLTPNKYRQSLGK